MIKIDISDFWEVHCDLCDKLICFRKWEYSPDGYDVALCIGCYAKNDGEIEINGS